MSLSPYHDVVDDVDSEVLDLYQWTQDLSLEDLK